MQVVKTEFWIICFQSGYPILRQVCSLGLVPSELEHDVQWDDFTSTMRQHPHFWSCYCGKEQFASSSLGTKFTLRYYYCQPNSKPFQSWTDNCTSLFGILTAVLTYFDILVLSMLRRMTIVSRDISDETYDWDPKRYPLLISYDTFF